MKQKFLLLLGCFSLVSAMHAAPLGTAFTYQGRLEQNGQPATNWVYSMKFSLYDMASGGVFLGTNLLAVPVTNGLFTTSLDYGIQPFLFGDATWLEIGVTPDRMSPSPAYTPLTPRTRLTPTPAANWANVAGLARNVTNGAVRADGLSTVGAPIGGQVLSYNGTSLAWLNPAESSGAWVTGGNTAAGGNFLGTVNNVAMDVRVNNARALRLEPTVGAPNVILGRANNTITAGVQAGTIGGGEGHSVEGNHSVIAGGNANRAGSNAAFVGGGTSNEANGSSSVLAGGYNNTASGPVSYIGGGENNVASGSWAAISGGQNNQVAADSGTVSGGTGNQVSGAGGGAVGGGVANTASGDSATVPGGYSNLAQGRSSFAAGNAARAVHDGSFVWADRQGTIFSPTPYESTAANQFSVRASGGARFETPTLEVIGNVTTRVLTITGGADLAEPFPMREEHIEKGSVVVIDREQPGQLRRSTRAYDKRVAGIVSGANGIRPGIALQQAGALDQGENVALTGRVYVKADASFGAIEPGDLLTSSDTPGHAMKVTDHTKAQGAVLGKAMSTLDAGTGLVLVLVTLQ